MMDKTGDFRIEDGILQFYLGRSRDLVIPEGVTGIGCGAFARYKGFQSITLPESFTEIRNYAFCNFNNLTAIHLPGSVTKIGSGAFEGCSHLKDIIIPEGVTEIGFRAFQGCRSLESITIPEGVTEIKRYMFVECRSLKSVTLPESVTKIGDGAFRDCIRLTSVNIPESVTGIGDDAFNGCSKLENIRVPDGITRIGASAFNHCKALAGKHGFIVVKGTVFGYYGRKPVTVIPEGAVKIGKDAFANCGRLRGLVIPESVTGIGPRAFSGCMNLADLTIPEHLAPSAGSFLPEEYLLNSAGCVIHTPDVSRLPARYRPYAAVGFAEEEPDLTTERAANHLRYIKSHAADLADLALQHPALLRLMCRERLMTARAAEVVAEPLMRSGDPELRALMMDYLANKVPPEAKKRLAQKKEQEQETVFERMLARTEQKGIRGLNVVVSGKLRNFYRGAEFKALCRRCGATPGTRVSPKTDLLICNGTPGSPDKNRWLAEELGIEIVSEDEFLRRALECDPDPYRTVNGKQVPRPEYRNLL